MLKKSLFVSRLHPEAIAEDLTEFVKQVFGLDASCTNIVMPQFAPVGKGQLLLSVRPSVCLSVRRVEPT